MARGVIQNFFRRILPGQSLRNLADVTNINRIANILNDIQGEGCYIEKPEDNEGKGWKIHYDGKNSDVPVKDFPVTTSVDFCNVNYATWNGSQWVGTDLSVSVNNVPVIPVSGGVSWASDGEFILHFRPGGLIQSQYGWHYTYLEMYGDPDVSPDPLLLWELKFGKGETVNGEHIFKRYIEGEIRLYFTGGDDGFAPGFQSQLRVPGETMTTVGHPLETIHNANDTVQWENEYPDGYWRWDSDENIWKRNDPDSNAVARNDCFSNLVRYINGEHGFPMWISLRALPVLCEEQITIHVRHALSENEGLTPKAREMWDELMGMCLTGFASPCEWEFGLYDRSKDEWNDAFGDHGFLPRPRWETEILPRWIWTDSDRDHDGNYYNLRSLVGSLVLSLDGYLATYDSLVTDRDAAIDEDVQVRTDVASAVSDIDSVDSIADSYGGILANIETTYLNLDARLNLLEASL